VLGLIEENPETLMGMIEYLRNVPGPAEKLKTGFAL
jgi:hypothetical protein